MRFVSQHTADAWRSGAFVDSTRPMARVTVQAPSVVLRETRETRPRFQDKVYSSVVLGSPAVPVELPNVRSVEWSRGIDTDVASCTITLWNNRPLPIGELPQEGQFDQPGYYSPRRGSNAFWPFTENQWRDVLLPDRIVRTYQGYGFDYTTIPELDPFLYETGVWLIDEVAFNADQTIRITCRDVGRLLTDHYLTDPVVPKGSLPLTFFCVGEYTSAPDISATWGQLTGYQNNSNTPWMGGSNLPINGHYPSDAADTSVDTYWLSFGNYENNAGYSFEWIQFGYSGAVNSVRLATVGTGYTVFVSLWDGTKWLGDRKVPYDPGHWASYPNGSDQMYVHSFTQETEDTEVLLPALYSGVQAVRFTFTSLWQSGYRAPNTAQGGRYPYRAAVRMAWAASDGVLVGAGTPVPGSGNIGDYCMDDQSQILTRQGWKSHDEVQEGDIALTLNMGTGMSEWQTVTGVYRKHRKRRMVSGARGTLVDSLTTPDHRWPVRDWRERLVMRTTETLSGEDRFVQSARCASLPQEKRYSDDLVELVAWYYTEGALRPGGATQISQSKTVRPELVERLDALMLRMFGGPGRVRKRVEITDDMVDAAVAAVADGDSYVEVAARFGVNWKSVRSWCLKRPPTALWSRRERDNGVVVWNLSILASQSVLEVCPGKTKVPSQDFLLSLTQEQLDLFIDVSMLADGHGVQFTQIVEERRDAFSLACVLAGRWVTQDVRPPMTLYGARFAKRPVTVRSCEWSDVDYEGVVWCPTIPNGTFFARRGQSMYFTGNTHIVAQLSSYVFAWWPDGASGVNFVTLSDGSRQYFDPRPPVSGNIAENLGVGDCWGSLELSGTCPVVPLGAEVFDSKTIMDGINYVKEILGFNYFVDEHGGAVFRSPNLFVHGNYVDQGETRDRFLGEPVEPYTLDVPAYESAVVDDNRIVLFEESSLLSYEETLSSRNAREIITVGTIDSAIAGHSTRGNVWGTGFRRVAKWTDQHFGSEVEAATMADMIGKRIQASAVSARMRIPAHPGIQVDDQVWVVESVTASYELHYVRSISSSWDAARGYWFYDLETNRLVI